MRAAVLFRVAALAAALGLASEAFAQSRTGTFGSRSTGSMSSGSRTLSSGSRSGSGSSLGSGSGLGSGAGGSTGLGSSFLIQRDAGRFIGSDSGDVPRVFGGMTDGSGGYGSSMPSTYGSSYGSGSRGGYGGYGSSAGMQSQSGLRGVGAQTGMRYGIGLGSRVSASPSGGDASRTGTDVGGGPVAMTGPDPFGSKLAGKLARSNRIAARTPLQVVSRGATVVLLGDVATFHDRELAEMYILLEPGVSAVDNRLTVAGTPLP